MFEWFVWLSCTIETNHFFPPSTHTSCAVRIEAFPECSKILQRKITLTWLTHFSERPTLCSTSCWRYTPFTRPHTDFLYRSSDVTCTRDLEDDTRDKTYLFTTYRYKRFIYNKCRDIVKVQTSTLYLTDNSRFSF